MNKQHRCYRFILPLIFLIAFLHACVQEVEPNITPMAELIFELKDENGTPIAGATVYLFPFQSSYNDYKNANQDGLYQETPNIALDNVATSDTDGRAFFPARDLQGNGFASGTQWIYRPNPLYVRAELKDGNIFLTNDDDPSSTRIEFGELGSGEVITITTEVIMR